MSKNMSNTVINGHPEVKENIENAEVGTQAPHHVCIEQLCEAAEICHHLPEEECDVDDEHRPENENDDQETLKEDVCECIYENFLQNEEARNKIKEEVMEMMMLGEFLDQFMIFFMEDLLDALFGSLLNTPMTDTDESKYYNAHSMDPEIQKSMELQKGKSGEFDKSREFDQSREFGETPQDEFEKVPEITDGNIYLWMSYFYLEYCGFKIFLKTLANHAGMEISARQEMAAMITDIVQEIFYSANYMGHDSDNSETFCKNIIWGILYTRRFHRRYLELTESQILAADIIDDILEPIFNRVKKDTVLFDLDLITLKSESPMVPAEPDCCEFKGFDALAKCFIDHLIERAEKQSYHYYSRRDRFVGNINVEDSEETVTAVTDLFSFPSIAEFSVDAGIIAIDGYISTWYYSDPWVYDIQFLMGQSDACSDYYFYEVVWSIPTNLYPVPQATASILFKIEVSRIKPTKCEVNVTYTFEGRGLVHTPNKYEFQEEWLFDILYSKLKLYEKLKF